MTELFRQQERLIREAYATGLNGTPDAFEGDGVTVVERPEPNWGYAVNAVTFARGTLVAVAPQLMEFALAHAPEMHRDATAYPYMAKLRDEARRLGLGGKLQAHSGAVCWGLSSVPESPDLPAGLSFEEVDAAWLNARIPEGQFENGAGPADGGGGRAFRNKYGIDVVAARQGEGLGRAAVAAAVRAILERGQVPFYGCAPNNIRSQRTALTTGFLPVCSDATVA